MAWLEKNRPNGPFQLVVRYGTQRLKRSTRTSDAPRANEIALRVDRRLEMLDRGELTLPDDVDLLTFLMSDGTAPNRTKPVASVTLEQVCDEYLDSLPAGSLEENTLLTCRIHMRHLKRLLGAGKRIRDINRQTLQQYVKDRAAQAGRKGKTVSTTTIKKELTTLGTVWRFALAAGHVAVPYPNRELRFPKLAVRPRFQTWQEIEHQIKQGDLPKAEQAELWDCLFLMLPEVTELLTFVEKHAFHDFLYPMVVAAAHTGARRSELVRSFRSDFDFRANMVMLREKTRVPGEFSTRTVPMSPELRRVMSDWFKDHPGGRQAFCIKPDAVWSRSKRDAPVPLTVGQAHDQFKRVLTEKWSRVRGWHVLRHSFASNCAAQGVDQRTINAWMGHQTEEMVRRYRHLIPDQQHRAMESVFGQGATRAGGNLTQVPA